MGEAGGPDLASYDHILVAFSGGKDSLACFLHLLDEGVPKEKIELWHHDIDGREGSDLMDWPVTSGYCRAFAEAFDVPIYYSWKDGGFEGEMLRENARTRPTKFECPDGTVKSVGGTRGKLSTRRKFPQVSANLSVRWCSAYLKVDVCSAAIRNQERFVGKRVLLITGERAEESAARENYKVFEPDRADNRAGKRAPRHVDHWRPVHKWTEEEVWAIIKRYKVRVHPCYYLGWGRCSCAACIFGSAHQFASLAKICPKKVERVANFEAEFGVTIKRKESVPELVAKGVPYEMAEEDVKDATSETYERDIVMEEEWVLPAGAYGESCGPS